MKPLPDNKIEGFPYHITRYTTAAGRITVVASQGDMSHAALDQWSAVVIEAIQQQLTRPALFLYLDLSHPNQGITPYGQRKLQEIIQLIPPDKPLYAASVLPNTLMFRVISALAKALTLNRTHIHSYLFTDHTRAYHWLNSQLAEIEHVAET